MIYLLIVTLLLLGVSVFFNYRYYRAVSFYANLYDRERKAHAADNMVSLLSSIGCLALLWISNRINRE